MSTTKVPVKHVGGGAKPAAESRNPLQSLRDEIDRVFERFAHGWPPLSGLFSRKPEVGSSMEAWPSVFTARSHPVVNIAETDSSYDLTAELPGLDEKDIELLLSDGVLTLQGEKKAEREDKNEDYHLTERRFGAFRRSFALPGEIDEKKVSARFSKGVLSVKLPKTAAARQRRRRIEIKSS